MIGPSGFFQNIVDSEFPSLSSDFEIIHDSENGFNILYKVFKNGRFFVYKALKPQYRNNPLYEELLQKDFNIGFSLVHNNICQYHGIVEIPDFGRCIVMEWVDGCNLEELISRGRIDRTLAKKIICELCDALDYMHKKQILHRDLKPENILITYNGGNVKLIDFGLSDTDSYNVLKAPAGTKVYASPELLSGEQTDSRSDIWSLGMIIGEMTGDYSRVVSRCLQRDKEKRFMSVADVKVAVLKYRSRIIWRSIVFFLISLLSVSLIWWIIDHIDIHVNKPEIEMPVQTDTTVLDMRVSEPVSEPVYKAAPIPVKVQDTEESVDATSLDEMFKEASEKL